MENTVGDEAKILRFREKNTFYALPAYFFTGLDHKSQLSKAVNLAREAKTEGKTLIFEIGYGNSLSPLDVAGSGKAKVVLGFDPQGEYPGDLRSGTEDTKIPKDNWGSFAAFFKLDARDPVKEPDMPKADYVYAISPFPNLVEETINLGLELSDKVYVVPNPNAAAEHPPSEIARKFQGQYRSQFLKLKKAEVEELIGTAKSAYLGSVTSDQKLDVIEVIRHRP